MTQKHAIALGTAVQNSPELAELSRRIELLAQAQRVLDSSQWRSMSLVVLSIRDGVLNISAANASVASKARQMAPSILAAVQRVNPVLQELRLKPKKVQSNSSEPVRQRIDREISSDALEALQMTASEMPAGSTRDALQRLIQRQLDRI